MFWKEDLLLYPAQGREVCEWGLLAINRVTAYRLGAERGQEVLGPPMPTAGSLAPMARTPGRGADRRGESR